MKVENFHFNINFNDYSANCSYVKVTFNGTQQYRTAFLLFQRKLASLVLYRALTSTLQTRECMLLARIHVQVFIAVPLQLTARCNMP